MTIVKTFARIAGLGLCVVAFAGTALAGDRDGTSNPPGQEQKAEKQEAKVEAKADARVDADAKTEAKAEKSEAKAEKSEAKPEKSEAKVEKSEAKATSAPSTKGQQEKAENQAAKAVKKAEIKVVTGTETKSEAKAKADAKATTTTSAPNQGEASKVLTVTGMQCANPIAGAKVEGGLGSTITVSGGGSAIAQVTLKSGQGATVVSSSFSAGFTSATITLSKDVSNYIVWTCGTPQPTDVCPNIAGVQTSVPAGMVKDAHGNCVPAPPVHGTDVCPNIAGVQTSVPAGMVKDAHGNCVTPAVAIIPDLCLNLAGVQTTVPAGLVRDAHGNCAAPTAHVTQTVVQTHGSVAQGTPVNNAAPVTEVKNAATTKAAKEQDQPSSGVLGEVTSAPESIAETATTGTLPFTGIPLWIAALLGGGLLATGFALRRAAQH